MGDIGSIFGDVTGANQQNLAKLQGAGYAQYQPGAAPALNMGAYGETGTEYATAAQIGPGANMELGNQQSLISQLQGQMNGSGPDLAQAQLRAGTQANLAGQLAAAAGNRGNQNAGAAQTAMANQTAAANQGQAAQAAQLRSQEQIAAEQGLGSTLGQVSGQQQQLAENQAGLTQAANLQNASAENQLGEFNTESAQAGNAAQQAQYQFIQNMQAQQQSNQNAAIAGQQLSAQNATQNAATGAFGGALNAAGAAGGSFVNGGGNGTGNGGPAQTASSSEQASSGTGSESDGADDGGDALGGVESGATKLVGEAGPEAIIPEHHTHVHLGELVDHPMIRALGSAHDPVAVVPLTPGAPMRADIQELLQHPDFKKEVAKVVLHHASALKAALDSRRQ